MTEQVDDNLVRIIAAGGESGLGFNEIEKLIALDKHPISDDYFSSKVIPIYGLTNVERQTPDLNIPAKFIDCLRLLKVVYIAQDHAGYQRVIDQTKKMATLHDFTINVEPLPVDIGGGDEPEPEDHIPNDPVDIGGGDEPETDQQETNDSKETLNSREINDRFDRVGQAFFRYKEEVFQKITPVARNHGLQLLNSARDQIADELIRYFSLYGDANEIVLNYTNDNQSMNTARSSLFSSVARQLNTLETEEKGQDEQENKPGVTLSSAIQGLIRAMRECHPLFHQSRNDLNKYNNAVFEAANPYIRNQGLVSVSPYIIPSDAVLNYINQDPAINKLKTVAEDAREELITAITAYGVDYPVIWRIFSLEKLPDTNLEWLHVVYETLDKAFKANEEFVNTLNADENKVWDYPLLIKRTINDPFGLSLPPNSIAYKAALEKAGIEELTYVDVAQLGVAGTQMAFIGAALLGLVSVSNPITFSIAAVDITLSLFHASELYFKAAAQQAGFDAVLNPADSPSGEPDWYWVSFEIFMDLTALIQ